MRHATYTLVDGSKVTIEYDPLAPCIGCGLPVWEASVGGTGVCPWCDVGVDRYTGQRLQYKPRAATAQERAMGKSSVVLDNAFKATPEQYAKAVASMTEAGNG